MVVLTVVVNGSAASCHYRGPGCQITRGTPQQPHRYQASPAGTVSRPARAVVAGPASSATTIFGPG